MRWLLLGCTVAAALVNWWSRYPHAGQTDSRSAERLELVTKPLTTALVIGLALVSGAPSAQITVAVIALALCLVGDIALLPVIDRFVVGLGAFLAGHIAFLVLFAQYGFDRWLLGIVAAVLAVALAVVVGRTIIRGAAQREPALRLPVIAYLVIISAMAVGGWSTGRGWVIAGSTLFVVSDSVLGWRQFVRTRPFMPVVVMATYHGALVALALSLW